MSFNATQIRFAATLNVQDVLRGSEIIDASLKSAAEGSSASFKKLNRQINNTPRHLGDVVRNARILNQNLKKTGYAFQYVEKVGVASLEVLSLKMRMMVIGSKILPQLNLVGTKMIGMAKNAQWLGRQLFMGVTLPLTLMATYAVRSFEKVNREYTKMKRVIGAPFDAKNSFQDLENNVTGISVKLSAAKTNGEAMMKMAKEMAVHYGYSESAIGGIISKWGASGLMGDDMAKATDQVAKLATLGDMDFGTAQKLIQSVTQLFTKGDFSKTSKELDVMALMVDKTMVDFEDMATALPMAANSAQLFGLGLKELTASISGMVERGVTAAEAATALKFSLSRITNPTKKARDTFKELVGVNLDESMHRAAKGTIEMGKSIQGASKGMNKLSYLAKVYSDLEKSNPDKAFTVIADLVGNRQVDRFASLLKSIEDFKMNPDANSGFGKAIKASFATYEEAATLVGKKIAAALYAPERRLASLKTKFQEVSAEFGKLLIPYALKGLSALVKILDKLNNMPDSTKKIVVGIAVLAAVMGPIVMVFASFFQVFAVGFKSTVMFANLFFKRFMKGALEVVSGSDVIRAVMEKTGGTVLQVGGDFMTFSREAAAGMRAAALATEEASAEMIASLEAVSVAKATAAGWPVGAGGPSKAASKATESAKTIDDVPPVVPLSGPSRHSARDAGGRFVKKATEEATEVAEETMAKVAPVVEKETAVAMEEGIALAGTRGIGKWRGFFAYVTLGMSEAFMAAFRNKKTIGAALSFSTLLSKLSRGKYGVRQAEAAAVMAGNASMIPGVKRGLLAKMAARKVAKQSARGLMAISPINSAEPKLLAKAGAGIAAATTATLKLVGVKTAAMKAAEASAAALASEGAAAATAAAALGETAAAGTGAAAAVETVATGTAAASSGIPLIGWVVAAVAASIALIAANWGAFTRGVREGSKWIGTIFSSAWGSLKDAFGAIVSSLGEIWNAITGIFEPFSEIFNPDNVDDTGKKIGGVGSAMQMVGRVVGVIGMALAGVAKIIALILQGVALIFVAIFKLIAWVIKACSTLLRPILTALASVFGFFIELFRGHWMNALKFLGKAAFSLLVLPLIAGMEFIADTLLRLVANIADAASWIPGIGDDIERFEDKIRGWADTDWVGKANKWVDDKLGVKKIKLGVDDDALKAAKEKMKFQIDIPMKPVVSKKDLKNIDIESFATNLKDAVTKQIDKMKDQATEAFTDMTDAMSESFSNAQAAAQEAFANIQTAAQEAFSKVQESIQEAFSSRQEKAAQKFENWSKRKLEVYDRQVKAIEKVRQVESRKLAQEEYLQKRREMLANRAKSLENYRRSRALAVYEGRGNDVVGLDIQEQQDRSSFRSDMTGLVKSRQHDLVEQERDDQIERINNQKEFEQKRLDNAKKAFDAQQEQDKKLFDARMEEDKKQFDIRQEADKKAFDAQQDMEKKAFDKRIETLRKNFEEQIDIITENIPATKRAYEKMVAKVKGVLGKYGANHKFAVQKAADMFHDATKIATRKMSHDADWSAETIAKRFFETYQNAMSNRKESPVFQGRGSAGNKFAADFLGSKNAGTGLYGVIGDGWDSTQWSEQSRKLYQKIIELSTKKDKTALYNFLNRLGVISEYAGQTVIDYGKLKKIIFGADDKGPGRGSGGATKRDKYHSGGYIGSSLKADEVPIIAQKGEFVINRRAVDKLGRSTLEALNSGKVSMTGMVSNNKDIFASIKNTWEDIQRVTGKTYDSTRKIVLDKTDKISDTIDRNNTSTRDKNKRHWKTFAGDTNSLWRQISDVIGHGVSDVSGIVGRADERWGGAFGPIRGAFGTPINFVISSVMNKFVKQMNKFTDAMGLGKIFSSMNEVPVHHTGGIVGQGKTKRSLAKGIRPDEQLIIAQKGERIIPKGGDGPGTNVSYVNPGGIDGVKWGNDLLAQMGGKATQETIRLLVAWQKGEGTTAKNNPLATTQGWAGATDFNSVGVKNYLSYLDGINATIKTIQNGHYPHILAALMGGDADVAFQALNEFNTWGTGGERVMQLYGGSSSSGYSTEGGGFGGATKYIKAMIKVAKKALKQFGSGPIGKMGKGMTMFGLLKGSEWMNNISQFMGAIGGSMTGSRTGGIGPVLDSKPSRAQAGWNGLGKGMSWENAFQAWQGRSGSLYVLEDYMDAMGVPWVNYGDYVKRMVRGSNHTWSMHARGEAVDFGASDYANGIGSPGMNKIFNALHKMGGFLYELIYAGSPNYIYKGQEKPMDTAGRLYADHQNHVHASLANGGIIKSRAGGTLIRAGEGGRHEAIIPLPRFGIQKMLKAFEMPNFIGMPNIGRGNGGGGRTEIHEHHHWNVETFVGEKEWFSELMSTWETERNRPKKQSRGQMVRRVGSAADNVARY